MSRGRVRRAVAYGLVLIATWIFAAADVGLQPPALAQVGLEVAGGWRIVADFGPRGCRFAAADGAEIEVVVWRPEVATAEAVAEEHEILLERNYGFKRLWQRPLAAEWAEGGLLVAGVARYGGMDWSLAYAAFAVSGRGLVVGASRPGLASCDAAAAAVLRFVGALRRAAGPPVASGGGAAASRLSLAASVSPAAAPEAVAVPAVAGSAAAKVAAPGLPVAVPIVGPAAIATSTPEVRAGWQRTAASPPATASAAAASAQPAAPALVAEAPARLPEPRVASFAARVAASLPPLRPRSAAPGPGAAALAMTPPAVEARPVELASGAAAGGGPLAAVARPRIAGVALASRAAVEVSARWAEGPRETRIALAQPAASTMPPMAGVAAALAEAAPALSARSAPKAAEASPLSLAVAPSGDRPTSPGQAVAAGLPKVRARWASAARLAQAAVKAGAEAARPAGPAPAAMLAFGPTRLAAAAAARPRPAEVGGVLPAISRPSAVPAVAPARPGLALQLVWLKLQVPAGWQVIGRVDASGAMPVISIYASRDGLAAWWRQPLVPVYRQLTETLRAMGYREGQSAGPLRGLPAKVMHFMPAGEFLRQVVAAEQEAAVEQVAASKEVGLLAGPQGTGVIARLSRMERGQPREQWRAVATAAAGAIAPGAWVAAEMGAEDEPGSLRALLALVQLVAGAAVAPDAPPALAQMVANARRCAEALARAAGLP